jgi:uncharacterized protein (DUF1501 family)
MTRRHALRFSLGAFLLPRSSATATAASPLARPGAKGVILILLEGGMSHLETWDPKPDAPAQIRGEFGTIATSLPSLRVGEHMPLLAQQAHLYNVIRSVHCDARNDHSPGMHLILTGFENTAAGVALERFNGQHPAVGSIIAHRRGVMAAGGVPRFVAMPWSKQLGGRVSYSTPAFLGTAYEAFETGAPPQTASQPMKVPPSLKLPADAPLGRVEDRMALRAAFNHLNTTLDRDPLVSRIDAQYQKAFEMLASQRMCQALEIGREAAPLRERYGNNPIGQALLLARRLVETGVTYVLVDPYQGAEWDTHTQNFSGHKRLLPVMDRAVSALLSDLEGRGMLDEVLVLLISEMGRTPIITRDAGRDHWTNAYSVMMAGGGLTRGQVLGSTTRKGEWPGDRPVTVPEILATVYQQLRIDPNTMIYDEQRRPLRILPEAKPIFELLA